MIVPPVDGLRLDLEAQDSIFKKLSSSLDLMRHGQSGSSDTLRRASKLKYNKLLPNITLPIVLCSKKVKFLSNLQI